MDKSKLTHLIYGTKRIVLPKTIWERFSAMFPELTQDEILDKWVWVMDLDNNDLEYGRFFPNVSQPLMEYLFTHELDEFPSNKPIM